MASRLSESIRRNLGLPLEGDSIETVEERPHNLAEYLSASVPSRIKKPTPTQRPPSQIAAHLRSAMLAQSEHWEILCHGCWQPTLIKLHPTQLQGTDFCQKCGLSLLISASDENSVRPVKKMKPIGERLKEAAERAAFRSASDQQQDDGEVPFWMVRLSKWE
jgi:hypothetical protein